jgi:hypothetical protein
MIAGSQTMRTILNVLAARVAMVAPTRRTFPPNGEDF